MPSAVLETAREIDSPWDEANALAGLGRCALADGERARGVALLRQAQQIFARIEATDASDLLAELQAVDGAAESPFV